MHTEASRRRCIPLTRTHSLQARQWHWANMGSSLRQRDTGSQQRPVTSPRPVSPPPTHTHSNAQLPLPFKVRLSLFHRRPGAKPLFAHENGRLQMGRGDEGAASTPGLRAARGSGSIWFGHQRPASRRAGAQACDCLGSPSQYLRGERCPRCIART